MAATSRLQVLEFIFWNHMNAKNLCMRLWNKATTTSTPQWGTETKKCSPCDLGFHKKTPNVLKEDIWFTTKISNASQGHEETKKAVKEISADVKQYICYC